jgi:PKD repeat protein
VTLEVSDRASLRAVDIMTVTVRDITPPVPALEEVEPVGQGATVILDGTGSTDNVGVSSWTWTIGDGVDAVILTGWTVNHAFPDAGEYNITLNVTDEAGNWATTSITIIVRDTTPPIAVAGDDLVIDQHVEATFNGRSSTDNVGIVNWTWTLYLGDTLQIYYEPIAKWTFHEAGNFTARLVVTDAAGNSATEISNVTVVDTTAPLAEAGRDLIIDQHDTVTLDATLSSDNVAITNCAWSIEVGDDPVELTGEIVDHTFYDATTYTVVLTVYDAVGNSDSDELLITVRDTTAPSVMAGPDVFVDQFESIQLDGSASADNIGVVNFSWKYMENDVDHYLYGETPKLTFDVVGVYRVFLIVADEAGNEATDHITVTVIDITVPEARAGLDRKVLKGKLVRLDGTTSTDNVAITNWSWSFFEKDGWVNLFGPEVEYTFMRPGTYTVKLRVVDEVGNEATDEVTVLVRAPQVTDDINLLPIIVVVIVASGAIMGAYVMYSRRAR